MNFYRASEYLAMQSAVPAIVNPSVCLSVTRWWCTVSKWLMLRSCGLHWTIYVVYDWTIQKRYFNIVTGLSILIGLCEPVTLLIWCQELEIWTSRRSETYPPAKYTRLKGAPYRQQLGQLTLKASAVSISLALYTELDLPWSPVQPCRLSADIRSGNTVQHRLVNGEYTIVTFSRKLYKSQTINLPIATLISQCITHGNAWHELNAIVLYLATDRQTYCIIFLYFSVYFYVRFLF